MPIRALLPLRRRRCLAVLLLIGLWAVPRGGVAQSDAGVWDAAEEGSRQKWAVLIGVNKYQGLRGLAYCRDDAQALSARLVTAGFPPQNVFLLADGAPDSKFLPLKANIERQLAAVLSQAERDDLVVVAFSGHGTHLGGTSYLCPAEARLDSPATTMLPLELLYQRLGACRARWKLLLVDACRNDPRPAGQRADDAAFKNAHEFAAALNQPREGILALTSCAVGQESVEAEEFRHGVFVHFLLEGLAGKADREEGNRNGRVSILELYRYTNLHTQRYVKQTQSREQTPLLRGEIPGDYELTAAAADPQVVSAVAQGDTLCRARRFDEGLAAFNAALRLDTKYAPAYERRAMVHVARRDYGAAITDYSLAIHIDPQPLYYARRSAAYSRSGEYTKALADADEALRLDPQLTMAYNCRGIVQRHRGELDRAVADFTAALRVDPKYEAAYANCGCVYALRHDWPKALADFAAALRIDPQYAQVYYYRGVAYNESGDPRRALTDFDAALRINPRYALAYVGRGIAYRRLGDLDQALAELQTAIKRDPKLAYAYRQRGQLYRQKKDLERALDDYSTAVRLEPRSAATYGDRGLAYAERRQPELALADFTAAIRLQPQVAAYFNNRSVIYRKKGDLERALADANEALRLDPQYALAYANRARIYQSQGKTELAAADEAQAARLAPPKKKRE